jgi:folate-binding protein YgfZ
MTPGYQALLANTAYVDVSNRGRIRVAGDDRARLIHALTTNQIQQLKPGDAAYAFFLTAQGRIVCDCYVQCYENHLLLDIEPEVNATILTHIDHYIIADDVTLEDVTGTTFSLLAAGKRIYGPLLEKVAFIAQSDLVEATAVDYEFYRLSRFHPLFGTDFGSSTLPQETGLTYALNFNKGCYLGQEIVERIRSRGHVNKMLVGLVADPSESLPALAAVAFNGEEIGQITSSQDGNAIAMLRVAATKPGTVVQVGSVKATVTAVS